MPILRERDVIELLRKPVDHRHDRIALADRKRASRAEIILHVDHEQQVLVLSYLHVRLRREPDHKN
jgi:hypothetical protein